MMRVVKSPTPPFSRPKSPSSSSSSLGQARLLGLSSRRIFHSAATPPSKKTLAIRHPTARRQPERAEEQDEGVARGEGLSPAFRTSSPHEIPAFTASHLFGLTSAGDAPPCRGASLRVLIPAVSAPRRRVPAASAPEDVDQLVDHIDVYLKPASSPAPLGPPSMLLCLAITVGVT